MAAKHNLGLWPSQVVTVKDVGDLVPARDASGDRKAHVVRLARRIPRTDLWMGEAICRKVDEEVEWAPDEDIDFGDPSRRDEFCGTCWLTIKGKRIRGELEGEQDYFSGNNPW